MNDKKGTSREYANNLRKLADWLDSKTEFPMPDKRANSGYQNFYDDKDGFLAAVRAVGAGTKGEGVLHSYLRFTAKSPEGTIFDVEVNRDRVCKLVRPARPAEYDCESLLSPEEHAELKSA